MIEFNQIEEEYDELEREDEWEETFRVSSASQHTTQFIYWLTD